jgi:hypothetical protein
MGRIVVLWGAYHRLHDFPLWRLFTQETLSKPASSLAIWLKCGHEMRQEAKKQLLQLLYVLADPESALVEAGLSTQAPAPVVQVDDGTSRRADTKRRGLDSARRGGGLSPPPPLPPSIRPKDVLSPSKAATGLPRVASASPVPTGAVASTSPIASSKKRSIAANPAVSTASTTPAASASAGTVVVANVDVLLERQKEVQREFKEAQELARKKEMEEETERLSKLRKDQELRRKKWEEEDAQRLQQLRNTMTQRQEQRSVEVPRWSMIFSLCQSARSLLIGSFPLFWADCKFAFVPAASG